jgi:serine/threonine protein kinase
VRQHPGRHGNGSVWFTGFGIASRLPREHQAPAPPKVIAGTLAYMAPEQTGRMSRSVDSRSDLYSLGVTSYEMLPGEGLQCGRSNGMGALPHRPPTGAARRVGRVHPGVTLGHCDEEFRGHFIG